MKSRQKEILRQQALVTRRSQSRATKARLSGIIQEQLLNHFTSPCCQWLIYRSMPDEVSTERLFLTTAVRIFAPVTHASGRMEWRHINADTRWGRGIFKVEEPTNGTIWQPGESKSLIVCPLLGFDRSGVRLGLGKGCFDRWLAKYHKQIGCRIGLAFSCQEFKCIPTEEHDVALDFIITEQEIIACNNT